MRTARLGLVLALACAAAAAQNEEPVQVVAVDGIKNPEMRSYRSVRAGFEEFDAHRAMAPNAELRFRMLPRSQTARETMDGMALRIVGEGDAIQVPIAPDGLFMLPRLPEGNDGDTDLILNRKTGMYSGRPDIRTAGLPDKMRRLGDLRLECKVTVAMLKTEMPFYARAFLNTLLLTADWCSHKEIKFGFQAPVMVASVTQKYGERTLTLATHEWTYQVKLGDPSWPDDTLVELTYK